MKLPGCHAALIEPAKVRDYLLSVSHPIGKSKGSFFRSMGYAAARWQELDAELRTLAASGDAVLIETTAYGRKYEVRGIVQGPSGRTAALTTVWIVRAGEEIPRLVTAYPGAGQ